MAENSYLESLLQRSGIKLEFIYEKLDLDKATFRRKRINVGNFYLHELIELHAIISLTIENLPFNVFVNELAQSFKTKQ